MAMCVSLCGLAMLASAPRYALAADSWIGREYRQFRAYPRLDRAYRMIKAGKLADARRLLEEVVVIDPGRADAWSALFETCVKMKDYACVTRQAAARLAARPGDADAQYFLAVALHHSGEATAAAEMAQLTLNLPTLSAERRRILAAQLIGDRAAATQVNKPLQEPAAALVTPDKPALSPSPATHPREIAHAPSRPAAPGLVSEAHSPARAQSPPSHADVLPSSPEELPQSARVEGAGPAIDEQETWHRRAQILREQGDRAGALDALRHALDLAPGNAVYLSEIGYLQLAAGDDAAATENLRRAREGLPSAPTLTPDIAYADLRLGRRDAALGEFRRALDEGRERAASGTPGHADDESGLFGLRRTVQYLEDRWRFNLTSVTRMDRRTAPAAGYATPQEYAGYGGLAGLDATYRLDSWPGDARNGRTELFFRTLQGMDDRSFNSTPAALFTGLGIRYRLLQSQSVFASYEYVQRTGAPVESDSMLRLSGSWGKGGDFVPATQAWTYTNLYADYARLARQGAWYATLLGEYGRHSRLSLAALPAATVMPYVSFSATANTDNLSRSTVTRVDAGAGISIVSWHRETPDRAYATRSRLSLEARYAVGGNTTDRATIRLKWELAF